jgi:hypothetical protein
VAVAEAPNENEAQASSARASITIGKTKILFIYLNSDSCDDVAIFELTV